MEDFITRCDKKFGRNSKCGQIATVKIFQKIQNKGTSSKCRCSKHSSGIKTDESSGISVVQIVHDWGKVNSILEPLVGKIIYSKWHRRELLIKYIKRESMIFMCQDPRFDETTTNKNHGKWQALYAKGAFFL